MQRTRVNASIIVIEAKLSVNLRAGTLEEVQAKMRTAHVNLVDMLMDEIRLCGAPTKALVPLKDVRDEALGMSKLDFNDPVHYLEATTKALDAHRRVFALLGQSATWDDHTPASSRASSVPSTPPAELPSTASIGPPGHVAYEGGDPSRKKKNVDVHGVAVGIHGAATAALESRRGRQLWRDARVAVADFLRRREKAVRMFNAARLCAQNGHHSIAVQLLEMSVHLCPLRDDEPRARIISAAMLAAGADEADRWKLEAAVLTEDILQPWPDTLVATMMSGEPTSELFESFGTLCETLDETPRFGVGARVLARRLTGEMWSSATVVRELHSGRRDVRLDSGELLMSLQPNAVLAPSAGGPGAVLRSAASKGAEELVRSLLRRGVSPFECNENGETPLHCAALHGRDTICRLLLEHRADSHTKDLFEQSPYHIAIVNSHLSVVQVFEPSATAIDITPFSQRASAMHQAAAVGDPVKVLACLAESDDALEETFSNLVTPLHVAALNAQSEVVQLLLHQGASPSKSTKRGVSCLMAALEFVAFLRCDSPTYKDDHRRALRVISALLEADDDAASFREGRGDSFRRDSRGDSRGDSLCERSDSVCEGGGSAVREWSASRISFSSTLGGSVLGEGERQPSPSLDDALRAVDDLEGDGSGVGGTSTPATTVPRPHPLTRSGGGVMGERRRSVSGGLTRSSSRTLQRSDSKVLETMLAVKRARARRSPEQARLIELPTATGDVPLLKACRCLSNSDEDHELLELLLRAGANINSQSRSTGHTPLISACLRGSMRVVKSLLDNSADPMAAISLELIPCAYTAPASPPTHTHARRPHSRAPDA